MRKASRRILGASLLFFVASMSTCFFGVRYAINRIPPEKLKRMGDTDWIGVEWIFGGGVLLLIAALLALVPPILWLFRSVVGTRSDW